MLHPMPVIFVAAAILTLTSTGPTFAVEGNSTSAEQPANGTSAHCEDRSCTRTQDDRANRSGSSTIVSNDSKSRYVALVINKSIALELAADVTDVLVANPDIADAVLRSNRRAYVIAKKLGQTNVYFYGAHGRQIEGLNINIGEDHEIREVRPEQLVMVVQGPGRDQGDKGAKITSYICGSGFCQEAEYAKAEKPLQPIIVLPNVTSVSSANAPAKP